MSARTVATVNPSWVYRTIAEVVADHGLPAPATVWVDGGRYGLTLRTPAEVDRWVRHLGLPPARAVQGKYASVQFGMHGRPVWCGASVVTVSCPVGGGV